jgi:hypothetical protein
MTYPLEKTESKEELAQKKLVAKLTEEWVEKYDLLKVNTFVECFPSDTNLTLKTIARKGFDKVAKGTVYVAIAKLATSFNITNNFTPLQIENLVNDIFEFYSQLTIRDLKLFFQQISLGQFDKNYNRLDAPLIFGYLEIYCNNRLAEIERDNEKYKSQNNALDNQTLLKYIAPFFKDKEKRVMRTEANERSKEKIRLEQEVIDGFVAKVRKDFEELHHLQGRQGAIMTVKYLKKDMDFKQFYETICAEKLAHRDKRTPKN